MAPWFQEEVRRELEKRFGTEEVHEAGLRVQTTLDLDLQQTANRAVADGLAAYERRTWMEAASWKTCLTDGATLDDYRHPDWAVKVEPGDYVHALVTSVLPLEIRRARGRPARSCCSSGRLEVDRAALWERAGQTRRRDLRSPGRRDGGRRAPRHARAGFRRARRADGHGQHHRRRAGHGGRARLRAFAVQPRHAVRAADRLQLQALRLHGGDRRWRQAGRHHRRRRR